MGSVMVDDIFEFVKDLENSPNVRAMESKDLEKEAKAFARETVDNNLGFFSNVRNRSAKCSVVIGSERVQDTPLSDQQKGILENLDSTLAKVKQYLADAPLLCVKRVIGSNKSFNPKCTLFLSNQRLDNIRQAYLWANTLREHVTDVQGPELYLVCIPEWQESQRQILCFPEKGLTVVLGSDYVGEVKMGFLRLAMWKAKEQGMLSLHAGSKIVNSKQENGSLRRHGVLFFGLSGTGKSTHSCHDHNMKHEGEGIEILQDDIVFLGKDGSALGTEKGFYLKTEGLNQEFQPVIHEALHGKETLLENVMVDSAGNIVLDNLTLGGNGRAVIPREAMRPYISEDINMPPLEELDGLMIFFITRRMTVLPLASKLNSEQAATAFMLGESIETSAGDPLKVGQSVRVVGTNPFVIGDPVNEGNWFYDFVKANEDKVQCFLLNTGGVGEIAERDANGRRVIKQPVLRVDISEMSAIIRNILRGTIEWLPEPNFGTMVPKSIEDLDINKFSLEKFYTKEQIDELTKTLHEERTNWLGKFDGLSKQVVDALSPTN